MAWCFITVLKAQAYLYLLIWLVLLQLLFQWIRPAVNVMERRVKTLKSKTLDGIRIARNKMRMQQY
jgi:ABC-type microcin C transport system permease subunit YejE